jgi:hypothetical protein
MDIIHTLWDTIYTWRTFSVVALIALLTALVYVYDFFFNSK